LKKRVNILIYREKDALDIPVIHLTVLPLIHAFKRIFIYGYEAKLSLGLSTAQGLKMALRKMKRGTYSYLSSKDHAVRRSILHFFSGWYILLWKRGQR
jgi:hypothetical protein